MARTRDPKRPPSRLRQGILVILLVFLVVLYLPVRKARLDNALVQAMRTGETGRAHSLLASGADPNQRLPGLESEAPPGMVELILRTFRPKREGENTRTRTLLMAASGAGDVELTRDLLAHGADPNAPLIKGGSALLFASASGKPDAVRALLDKGARVGLTDSKGNTPLLRAAERGDEAILTLLLDKGADIHAQNKAGETPLFLAARSHRDDAVRLLLQRGATTTDLSCRGVHPLLIAAQSASLPLIAHICDHEKKSIHDAFLGPAALNLAIQAQSEPTVRYLLARSVCQIRFIGSVEELTTEQVRHSSKGIMLTILSGDKNPTVVRAVNRNYERTLAGSVSGTNPPPMVVEVPNVSNDPPLIAAIHTGNLPIARLLLPRESDIGIYLRSEDAVNPAIIPGKVRYRVADSSMLAPNGDTPLQAAADQKLEMLQWVYGFDRNANTRDSQGQTPLLRTIMNHPDCARFLIAHGADVNTPDFMGNTPLMRSVDVAVTKLLLEHHARPNVCNKNGDTPLLHAVSSSRPECVRLLLQHAAKPNVVNKQQETPLSIATRFDSEDMMQMLIKAGAKQ